MHVNDLSLYQALHCVHQTRVSSTKEQPYDQWVYLNEHNLKKSDSRFLGILFSIYLHRMQHSLVALLLLIIRNALYHTPYSELLQNMTYTR